MQTARLLIGLCVLSIAPIVNAAPPRITASPSASYAFPSNSHGALCDAREPSASDDGSIPRLTFWSHRGTDEWVQYDFNKPAEVSSVEVYWFDDRPGGGCRVPLSWKLLHEVGYTWLPLPGATEHGVAADTYNKVTFDPVVVSSLRLQVRLQPGMSAGILEWKINGQSPKLWKLGPVGDGKNDNIPSGFDFLATRLALAALCDALGSEASETQTVLARVDELLDRFLSARSRAGFGEASALATMRQAVEELTEIQTKHGPHLTLPRLYEVDPDRCLRLMIHLDWLQQDREDATAIGFLPLATLVIDELAAAGGPLAARRDQMLASVVSPGDPRWMQLYLDACDRRRAELLRPHADVLQTIVFTKHHDIGGQHYAYTEDVSDSPYRDNNPFPNTGKLCLLEMDGAYGKVRTLIDEPEGLIRDPEVSFDGKRILFAWRKSMTEDDYHLYEMTVDDGAIRQLTSGRGVADYEPAYLPNGDIIFNSSRCQQIVDCWWADVSNLFTCDGDGRFLRRISFDQVHTNYPKVLADGRVIYTRWDYNDRGQLFPQPLFQMNADGTGQTEFYGNNSWFPTTILHARGIPGSHKLLCVLSGHHTYQK
ncbi:MAG TPA: hypothetical protein VE890_02305, partial [Thermoguttaceae bacterium]|nr:hypothetical protein [Thermoguttaceae bacterium]